MTAKKPTDTKVTVNDNVKIKSTHCITYKNNYNDYIVNINFHSGGDLHFCPDLGYDEGENIPWFLVKKEDVASFIEVLTKYVKDHTPNV